MFNQNEINNAVEALTAEERLSIERFYGVWKTKQTQVLYEVCSPDWQDIPLAPGQKAGPPGLQEIINRFSLTFPDVEIVIHEIYGTHERAGVRAEISFTHNADLLGIPSTQKKVAVALHEFHHLKDGKLTHTWHLEDWFGLLLQSGAWTTNGFAID
ncbi:Predicted ester cyclase [Pedobacter westerhofensis]|uniref:Predicted ester cyclase n=1 Tax=Pedobacter westerhofensis TaxID=425512 RepID=A0A521AE18_9SPHI|nr:ester cyclase [Pedobacter westerhofensis]SMO33018.1 Predicted ester cyclase [Pedobacter westerhofensis]